MKLFFYAVSSAILIMFASYQGHAQTSSLFDFNTEGELFENFNQSGSSVNITQSSNTGIGGTGAINVTSASTSDVFTTKEGYSLGVTGSEYVFESYIKSVWNSGYSGLGFTNASPANATGSFPFRPNVGLGISVHGGGYVFHNNGTNTFGNWSNGAPTGVTVVKYAGIFDLLNNGSPDDWYRVVFRIERVSPTTYDMRVEIWPALADGTLITPAEADAIIEMNGVENAEITGSDILYSYFSFSGSRVSDFDNYAINLAGGATVVEAGAPVVFTQSSSLDNNVITVNGDVANENGSDVSARGIVYGTSTNPNESDNLIESGSGAGEFVASTPALAAGTYYLRTFATNEVGTSYGSEVVHVIESPAVPGCTDSEACNYDAAATENDGSCTYPSENYLDCAGNCLNDADQDGVCDELEVPGCTDESACNFAAAATEDDGSCTYPAENYLDCSGNCLNDADQDGVCDELEVPGCTDESACNFVAAATDEDGSCTYPVEDYLDCAGNCLNDADQDGVCDELEIIGCMNESACNYNPEATDADWFLCEYPESGFDCEGNCLYPNLDVDYLTSQIWYEGPADCETGELFDTMSSYVIFDANGTMNSYDSESGELVWTTTWEANGCVIVIDEFFFMWASGDNYIGTGKGCWGFTPAPQGCTDETACNFDAEADFDDDSCTYPAEDYLDCAGNCLNDADEDGVCDELEVPGCTDESACNFVAAATDEDDSCTYPVEDYLDCAGNCLNDADEDGVCDELEVPGCTDESACNFVAAATDEDGSCTYPVEDYLDCAGNCLNDADEDGVCDELEVAGCTDESACNFVAEATDEDGSCEYAVEFYDCDGNCLNDADEDGICDELEIEGCMNRTACNYNPEATDEDGSCIVLMAQDINGPEEAIAYETTTYSYPQAGATTVEWGIENGTIVSGQGSGTIEVVWDDLFYGSLWCQEFYEECSGPLAEKSVSIRSIVNSVEEGEQLSVKIYPNPSSGQITVDPGTLKELAQLEIFDATGRMVHQTGINGKAVLQLNHLAGGNYVVKLVTNNNIITERLLIQH